MSWRTPTETDLAAYLSQSEIDAFRKDAAMDGTDPVERILSLSAEYVRGYIRSSSVAMSPTAKEIPEGMIPALMAYITVKVLLRIDLVVNESRAKAYSDALELFKAVGDGDYKVDSYGTTSDIGGGSNPAITVPVHILDDYPL